MLPRRDDKVNFSEELTILDIDVDDVRLEGEDEPCEAFRLEVDLSNLVSLIVDVLVHGNEHLRHQRADPSQEVVGLVLQILNILVALLVNIHDSPDLEAEGEVFEEVYDLISVFRIIVVLDLGHQ